MAINASFLNISKKLACSHVLQRQLFINLQCRLKKINFDSCRFASVYKAAVLKEINKPIEISEVNIEKLKKGQVRIAVKACALNASDLLMCQGISKVQPKLPFIPGYEISGEVLEVNLDQPVKKSKPSDNKDDKNKKKDEDEDDDDDDFPLVVGDRVVGLCRDKLGGFGEQCIADQRDVWRLPSSLDYKTAVGLADTYSLALLGLFRRAQIRANDVVVITAGAGGLGLAAVDIAANVYKSKVIGVCGTEKSADVLRNKGAWSAITYSEKKLKNKVLEMCGVHGADIVFETIGGGVFQNALQSVAHEGKVIIGGFASHSVPEIPISELLSLHSFSLIGVSLRDYRESNFNIYRQTICDVLELFQRGLITPLVSNTFNLEQINDALYTVKLNEDLGKVVILLDQK